jgi:hypothetical protein
VLAHCSEDHEISPDDLQGLAALREALSLSDADIESARIDVLTGLYRGVLVQALADGHLSDEEKESLEDTRRRLGMSANEAERVYAEEATKLLTWTLKQSLEDGRYTQDEERFIAGLAENLGAKLVFDDRTARLIERGRALARIEAGELPTLHNVPIKLQRGEVAHTAFPCIHKELRTITKTIRYSGPTASIRILKNVRWRVGSVSLDRVQQDVLAELGSGVLYITSARALFVADTRVASIPLGKIVRFTVYSDGLEIQKDSGRPHYFIRASSLSPDDPQGDALVHGTILDVVSRNSRHE